MADDNPVTPPGSFMHSSSAADFLLPDRAGQGPDKAEPDKAGPDKAGPDKAGPGRTRI